MLSDIDFKNIMQPLWTGNNVLNETVVFFDDGSSECDSLPLLFPPNEIISVKSYDLRSEYTLSDYKMTNEGIARLPGSSIPLMPVEAYINKTDHASWPQTKNGDGAIVIGNNDMILKYYLCVTYRHEDVWRGVKPESQLSQLPALRNKLKNKETVKLVFFGDSITVGWNASGLNEQTLDRNFQPKTELVQIAPFTPSWAELVTQQLYKSSGCVINKVNLAVSGTESSWGMQPVNIDRISGQNPDLLIIAFGMNECESPDERFKNNLVELIGKVSKRCPDTEFLLVSSMSPTPLCYKNERLSALERVLYDIGSSHSEWHIAIAPVNSVFRYIEKRKRIMDLLANNINHPNDFAVRIYAHTVSTTLDFQK